MIYTYDYDLTYVPAMPMVTIQIGRPDSAVVLNHLVITLDGLASAVLVQR